MHGIGCGRLASRDEMAKQQAYAQEMATRQSFDEPRQNLMGAFSTAIENQGDALAGAVNAVDLFLDRLGMQPEQSEAANAPPPCPPGMMPAIERSLARNQHLLDELRRKIGRLDEIA